MLPNIAALTQKSMYKTQYLDSKELASKGRVPRERDQIPNMKSQPPFDIVILPFIQHIFTEHKHCVGTVPGALEGEVKERNNGLRETGRFSNLPDPRVTGV